MSEAYDYTKGFADRAQVSLRRRDRLRTPLAEGTDRAAGHRVRSLGSLPDPDSLRDLAAELRDAVLARLDDHLEALAENWEANGGRTFFAADAKEANDYVAGIVRRTGARTAVKSKSMVSEEIRLNHMLQGLGVDVVETDLGEYIIQMAGEHPSHIVAPAIHRSRQDVARIFSALAGRELPDDAPSLMTFARERLRQRFLSADIGFSGCNFAVSSQGAVCLVTNEGNARMCTSLPKVHVALMGMERV
ncbi:MAG TPA: LUD domain-containing protein, partial [Actinomycetota bacterium]|nr:LUD domain-containing protein [Actinomycetota bacterium]